MTHAQPGLLARFLRPLVPLVALVAATLLAGCAGMNSLTSDVSSYGDWPADRKPGSYAFDRLPSQQARAEDTERLEAAARPALEKAGFQPVAAGEQPDVLVQVGARVSRAEVQPWDDPLWWRGSFGYWRGAPWYGPGGGLSARFDSPRYDRQVALLLRDRSTGKKLFEAQAHNESGSLTDPAALTAMFEAALFDFPKLGLNPRPVTVPLLK